MKTSGINARLARLMGRPSWPPYAAFIFFAGPLPCPCISTARRSSTPCAGHLTQPPVDGMGAILDFCPASLSIDTSAYGLTTTFHETARIMRQSEEFGRGKGRK